ncbi:MAG: hypothetical protein IKM99_01990 [Bacteroidales bacterium]|nr:hypothetical protein [Bacteroidales bacterium]
MKKKLLLIFCLMITVSMTAQEAIQGDALRMRVNSISANDSIRINNYMQRQRKSRSFLATAGLAVLGTLVNDASSIFVTEIMNVANIRSNMKAKWDELIENECYYLDSLTFMNSLSDFYKQGSFDGPLDPADLNFNGFTLNAQHNGKDVLKFYCHVDTDEAGLNQIFNHSKFKLVLDSMYFDPYSCHLPNMAANYIYPDEEKDYGRNLTFSFDDRENLIVGLYFSISSSWYNEAVMLAKNVHLGSFNVQIPIEEYDLEDGLFIYKREIIDANREYYMKHQQEFDPGSPLYDSTLTMPDTTYLNINGDCFIVPRSYMPLPGGVAHWGTGEYNVEFYFVEQCNITDEMRENWRKDYRKLNKMKKESVVGTYLVNLYHQYGSEVVRTVIETVSGTALDKLNF